jgi:hypothetical protein
MSGRRHEAGEWDRIREAGRIAADRRARAAAEAERGRQINATPQTLAKCPLRRDAVALLVASGRLRPNQQRAAAEILEVYTAITCAMLARTARYDDAGGGLAEDWPAALCVAYRARYVPWREYVGQQRVGRVTRGDLCLAVVVDNRGPTQAGEWAGVDRKTAIRAVQQGLYAYCVIAGWLEDGQLAAETAHAA